MKAIKILLICSFAITSSCDSFLDVKPTDVLTDENALVTIDDFRQALTGCYGGLTSGLYYGGTFIVAADRMSDDLRRSTENLGEGVQVHSFTINAGTDEPDNIWTAAYVIINRANLVINKIDGVSGSDQVKRSIKGQALFIRALCHFDLVRSFSQRYDATPDASHLGVPIMTESKIGEPPRNTVAEVYSRVITDLLDARDLMNESNLQPIRATRIAANALLARVSLYTKDWSKAKEYSTVVLGSNPILAMGDNYKNIWTTAEASNEVIFKLVMLQNDAQIGQEYWSQSNDIVSFNPTQDIINLYDKDDDIRFTSFIGIRQPNDPDNVVAKYRGASLNTPLNQKPPIDGLAHIKILRLSEMFLIRAEASYQLLDQTAARNDLNAVRKARIDGFDAATDGNQSGIALYNAIINERRKELAFEGHRWHDLKRLGLPVTRGADCSATQCVLPADDYRFTLPIPRGEFSGNRNMVQNPGYDNN